jgi:hypothetical protein
MRRALAAAILSLLSVFPASLLAQQGIQTPPIPARDPQAMAVLRQTLAALGAQSVASIQDTVIHAATTPAPNSAGEPGTVTITTKGVRLIRIDGAGGTKNSSTIFNAGREMRSSDNGWLAAPAANANHKRIEHLPALMLAYEIARGDLSAAYVGEETIAARSVHHIRLARASQRGDAMDARLTAITELDVFVDAQTFLIAKIAFPHASEIDWRITFPVEIYYDQYQVVSGIAVPHRQRYFFNGRPVSELQITSVAINQGTPDSAFEAR